MVKQKKRTCVTQSGKNYAINSAIQGVRLIWKQKIWLAICKFLWSLTNQNAWFVSSFLHCLKKNSITLNQSKWRNFFMYIISIENGYEHIRILYSIDDSWFRRRISAELILWIDTAVYVGQRKNVTKVT